MGLCWKNGALYAAEAGTNRVIKIADAKTSLVAGSGKQALEDGAAAQASFSLPEAVAADDNGAVYVSDTGNIDSAIRKISDGQVSTLADQDKSKAGVGLVSPSGLLVQGKQLYICDPFSRKLFVLTPE